ncbi:protein XRI1-like isoform X2 [Phoenix dactylifera]|uniref:Protein XRI1-like isoform X2 n=1 Tax=Phoenix dactylifera TaxID=42345 RepID=A0A8B9AVX5_PHODC|nr:protein XRI1-like isoform X2 [Phoenix dactylifera]
MMLKRWHDLDISDTCEWREEDYHLPKEFHFDVAHPLWDNIDQIDDDIWSMLGNQTPIRDCGEFGLDVLGIRDNANKGLEECGESSQHKRRRMLQFSSDGNDTSMGNEQITFTTVNSKVGDLLVEDVPLIGVGLSENMQWTPQLNSCFPDGRCVSSNEGLDHSSNTRLADCLNETEMHYNTDDMLSSRNDHVASYCQVGFSAHELETEVVQETTGHTTLRIFKGKKSHIKSPTKLTSSVAYPFTLIKPCGVHGDMTLKDINQRIHATPTSLSKLKNDEEPSLSYPTSAFSGKPVVVKTKIHTEGGKGSITILRTKG